MKKERRCEIEGCERIYFASGLCNKHYQAKRYREVYSEEAHSKKSELILAESKKEEKLDI